MLICLCFRDHNGDSEEERILNEIDEEDDPEFVPPAAASDTEDEPVDSSSSEDDEDLMERYEYEVEESVAQFRDEVPIRHDVFPDSESDEEDDAPAGRRMERNRIRRGDGRLVFGQVFYSGVAFKEAVLDYVLRTGMNIRQCRYDKTKLAFKCDAEDDCKWRIYCSLNEKRGKWQVKVFDSVHTCIPNGECFMFKVPIIARIFLESIRADPKYMMPQRMEEIIRERWKISATRNQCQEARKKALKWIAADYDKMFAHLRDYGNEIMDSNPGSTVEVVSATNGEGEEIFDRFYVCFDIIKRAWRNTCRPIIGVDGCFIKTSTGGQLLVAVGRDADNRIFPLAWAVVGVENYPNWLWFIKLLSKDLNLADGEDHVLVSDRQKGLIKAVQEELPHIEHRMCVRHIYGNLKAKHGSKAEMKPKIWTLAWSYNETEYQANLASLRAYDMSVYMDVMRENPKNWCRAFFNIGSYSEDVDNNFTESYNRTLLKAREKAMVPMLETIRRQAMVRMAVRSAEAESHKGKCTPYVAEFLEAEHKDASECRIFRSTKDLYEVELGGVSFPVSMKQRTCSCRKWDITGIPCEHAYGVILFKKMEPNDFVCSWFHTSRWRNTYATSINPMRGARFWPKSSRPLLSIPPQREKHDGKKHTKKNMQRKKGKNESPVKKASRLFNVTCAVCGQSGHNSRKHKEKNGGASGSQNESQFSQVLDD